ncbi:MAG: hypothetical protein C4346_10640 [Chloroflexota bacterium]
MERQHSQQVITGIDHVDIGERHCLTGNAAQTSDHVIDADIGRDRDECGRHDAGGGIGGIFEQAP